MHGTAEPPQHPQLGVGSVGQVVDGHGESQPRAVLGVDVPVTGGLLLLLFIEGL